MPDTFKGFAQNYLTKYFFGLTKDNLLALGGGITGVDPDFDEDTDDVAYYDLNGGKETISNGMTFPFKFEGNRKYGDEGQELIRGMLTSTQRKGYLRVLEPDGRILQGDATVSAIKPFGGDTLDRSDVEFTISFAGTPTDLKPADPEYPNPADPTKKA